MPSNRQRRLPRPVLATLIALVALATGAAAPAMASDPSATLGVYAGPGAPQAVADFEQSLGRPVDYVHDYFDKRSWTTISTPTWWLDTWGASGRNDQMVFSVPMLPDSGGTLVDGAAGSYNQHFEQLARTLIAGGEGSAVLRLGFEFNGTWFAWSIAGPGNPEAFAEYWRQIVRTMRAVPGADFKFDWSPISGGSWVDGELLNPELAWPGDAYVDYIGLDQYDQGWGPNYEDPAARWETAQTQPYGMRWHRDFAAAHGKPMTFPEWGLAHRADGHGGGDNPYFIEQMHKWIAANNVAYHLYFEYADASMSSQLFDGSSPLAAETFIALFGATAGTLEPTPEPAPAPEPEPAPAPEPEPAAAPEPEPAAAPEPEPAPAAVPEPAPKKEKKERKHPAKLQVSRSSVITSTEQLDVLAPITKRASGTVDVALHAAGRHESFQIDLEAGEGRLRFDRPIPNRQAQMGTGILTISYPGNGSSRPQEVRLRAASRQAQLDAQRPRYEDGRVQSKGTISSRARGVVRVQLEWVTAGEPHTIELDAKIRNGRWSLDETLAPELQASIADRDGTLHSYTLFTGYLPAKMRGEMQSYQVLGDR